MTMLDLSEEDIIQLLDQYHPFVRHIAKSACYSSSTIDINDLCQVGDIAVLRAIKSYDPSSGKNIKSFVISCIRNAIFNEAASFLGVFTVSFVTTNQASYALKLHDKGKSDNEIASILTKKYGRHFDADHVKDMRIAYKRNKSSDVTNQEPFHYDECNELTIKSILESSIRNEVDRQILENRILNNISVKDLSKQLGMARKDIYEREAVIKERIKQAIKEVV